MSNSPPSSSVGRGAPSSPYAGTDPTLYSPEVGRQMGQQPVAQSSKAAGKRPVVVTATLPPPLFSIGGITYRGLNPDPHVLGTFVNEIESQDPAFISRHILVQVVPGGVMAGVDHEYELAKVHQQMKQYACFDACVPIYSRGVHLRFDNLRDATEGKHLLEGLEFLCCFIDNYQFALAKSQDTAKIDEFEGQVRIVVRAKSAMHRCPPTFDRQKLEQLHQGVEQVLRFFGDIRGFVHTHTDIEKLEFVFRFEFFSVEAANRAVASLTEDKIRICPSDGVWSYDIVGAYNWNGDRPANSPHRRLPRIDDKGRLTEYRHAKQQVIPSKHPADHTNRVTRRQIENGSDVRTTIMLRNIPNKLDWMSLKALLDQKCFGTYDFVYLRIDFKSGHNVGYAFINFSDVKGMLAMLDQVAHAPWDGYRSSKNAEISYATIQGKEALTQKFRNSSVMQQTPYCRPRLFYSYDEAMALGNTRAAGIEYAFPPPDNWSKLQRSMESADSVGLYPPTGVPNQAMNRHMMSAYDRGTPRDMVHSANMQNQFGPNPSYTSMSDYKKRKCEKWHAETYGFSQNGIVPFEHISAVAIREFMEYDNACRSPSQRMHTAGPSNPGIIGRPAGHHSAVQHPGFGVAAAYPAHQGSMTGTYAAPAPQGGMFSTAAQGYAAQGYAGVLTLQGQTTDDGAYNGESSGTRGSQSYPTKSRRGSQPASDSSVV